MLKPVILSFIFLVHPVHVSLMSVEYNEKPDVFNVFLKIYTDDFLLDYRLLTGDTTKINISSDKQASDRIIRKYLEGRIEIFEGEKKLTGELVKFENSDGEIKMDLKYFSKKRDKKYLVRNLIMTDLYKDQTNLLIFRYMAFEEGVKFTSDITDHLFVVN
jgi:hypothetical protein